jgi:cystathionine beta-lyase family protein involved in aluminum resistance
MPKLQPQKVLDAKLTDRLEAAYNDLYGTPSTGYGADGYWRDEAEDLYAVLRAAVYAVVPGRQRAPNIRDHLNEAVKAACRVIRRRA